MKQHVYPSQNLQDSRYAIVKLNDVKYLIDLKEAEVILTATADVTIYSHSIGAEPVVHTEEYVVDESQILGQPNTQKKLQSAMTNLRRERAREKANAESGSDGQMRSVFGTGESLEDDLENLFA